MSFFYYSTKVLLLILLIVTLTGCTQNLKEKDGKIVKNDETGQTITENIICRPTDKETLKIYEENKVNIEKLPEYTKVENKQIKYVTNDEIEANQILNIFKTNQVTPINSEEVIVDLFRNKF